MSENAGHVADMSGTFKDLRAGADTLPSWPPPLPLAAETL
jgi:hypothetical protein